uniref:SFRICE_029957 n=1 Tax=Spodoptera frugiperda TaxID=7108 RepID=A0A2H1WI02_SPOFR
MQTDHLMVSNRRCPRTPERSYKCVADLLGLEGGFSSFIHRTKHKSKHCFTSDFCEAVVSLQSSQPNRAEAWLYYDFMKGYLLNTV